MRSLPIPTIKLCILLLATGCVESPEVASSSEQDLQWAYTNQAAPSGAPIPIGDGGVGAYSSSHQVYLSGNGTQPASTTARVWYTSIPDSGVPYYSSCGMTFISPHYAITAAHCLSGPWVKKTIPLHAQSFAARGDTLTPAIVAGASVVFGTDWTDMTYANTSYQNTIAAAANGFDCSITYVCAKTLAYDNMTLGGNCPTSVRTAVAQLYTQAFKTNVPMSTTTVPDITPTDSVADVALVYCANRPAGPSGTLDWIATGTGTTVNATPVAVHWFHEVVLLPYLAETSGRWTSYGLEGPAFGYPNWHYTQMHQVFPIRTATARRGSTTWNLSTYYWSEDNTIYAGQTQPWKTVGSMNVLAWTNNQANPTETRATAAGIFTSDIPSCTGMSGSGLFGLNNGTSPYLMGVANSTVSNSTVPPGSPISVRSTAMLGSNSIPLMCQREEDLQPPTSGGLIQPNTAFAHPLIVNAMASLAQVVADR